MPIILLIIYSPVQETKNDGLYHKNQGKTDHQNEVIQEIML